jgi:4-carboxymuconolactone decarboxylase
MPNVFKALANNPAVMDRVAAVGEYMRFQSKIDPQLRELAILTTAQEIRCAYEWTAHYTIAQKAGVPARLLSSIGTPQIEREPAPLGAELRFARLVARGEAVDDATFDAVKNHLGNAGVVQLSGWLATMVCSQGCSIHSRFLWTKAPSPNRLSFPSFVSCKDVKNRARIFVCPF